MLPINIEKIEKRGCLAVFQNIHQHAIATVVGHVIGHDVLKPTEPESLGAITERRKLLLAAKLGVELIRVDDIIAVLASGPGIENRRSVNVGDAELMQIRQHRFGVAKTEIWRKLQSVGCRGNSHNAASLTAVTLRRARRETARFPPPLAFPPGPRGTAAISPPVSPFRLLGQPHQYQRAGFEIVAIAAAHVLV